MADEAIPPDIERFVLDCIPTVVHLEALLLMRSHPDQDVSADAMAHLLYVQTRVALEALGDLVARGLLVSHSVEGPFRYGPSTPERSALVDRLAEVYRTRLILLSRFIHEQAQSRSIHDFANAFRLRKD